MGHQDLQALQDPRGPQDLLEFLDHKVFRALLDSLGLKVPKEIEVKEVNLARRVKKEIKGLMEKVFNNFEKP